MAVPASGIPVVPQPMMARATIASPFALAAVVAVKARDDEEEDPWDAAVDSNPGEPGRVVAG